MKINQNVLACVLFISCHHFAPLPHFFFLCSLPHYFVSIIVFPPTPTPSFISFYLIGVKPISAHECTFGLSYWLFGYHIPIKEVEKLGSKLELVVAIGTKG